jgi:hypothetical protein
MSQETEGRPRVRAAVPGAKQVIDPPASRA